MVSLSKSTPITLPLTSSAPGSAPVALSLRIPPEAVNRAMGK